MRIASWGQAVFAATLVVIGIQGFVRGDLGAIWQPVPKFVPMREGLASVCAFVSVACGVGLVLRWTSTAASRLLFAFLLAWLLLCRLPFIAMAPGAMDSWENSAEQAVLVAGAWVLYAAFAGKWDWQHLGFVSSDRGVRVARRLYGLAMIPFGIAHFAYLKETASLVPGWLPSHEGWAVFTGCAYLAAGVAILTGVLARLAAALSTVQMGGFTVLVWAPVAVSGAASTFQWNETLVSLALTAGGWLVTESYRGRPWLGRAVR